MDFCPPPSPIDLNNSPGDVLRLSKCLYRTNAPLQQQLCPHYVEKVQDAFVKPGITNVPAVKSAG